VAEYIIYIPNWHPTSDNKLKGKWSHRKKTSDMQMMATYALKARVPKATGRREVEIILTVAHGTSGRRPDPTNYYKSTLDGLARTGYLIDDSTKWLQHKPTRVEMGEAKATTIKLTDMEGT